MKLMMPNDNIPPPQMHQEEALKWTRDKDDPSFYGLFMEPGTGKTKVSIMKFAELWRKRRIDVVLTFAPNGVHNQWVEDEIPKHCPIPWRSIAWVSNRTRRWKDNTLLALKRTNAICIVTMNWEALITKDGLNFCRWLLKQKRVFMIADESSRIRNWKAIRTKVALDLAPKAAYRSILTGTPLVKGFENLWAQMEFLSPDILKCPRFPLFRSLYCKTATLPIGKGVTIINGYQRIDELMSLINPHVFVKNKKDCLDIPDKIPVPSPIPMSMAQAKAYATMEEELIVHLSELERVTVAHVIAARAKLRQIAIGFILDKQKVGRTFPNTRFERCLEHLEEAPGKTILWTSFRFCLAQWEEVLTKNKIGYVRYQKGDNAAIRQWKQNKDCKVFLSNPHSGGIGLNLAEADTMIFFNNVDDAEIRWQAEDRAHRMGQTQHLHLIDMFAPGTIESRIMRQQMTKEALADIVMRRNWKAAL